MSQSREVRWFFHGPPGDRVQAWFDHLEGVPDRADPRLDVYLLVPGRDDVGLKVREGRLEIKVRASVGTEYSLGDGSIVGVAEDWTKHKWTYAGTGGERSRKPEVRVSVSAPFEVGSRVRVRKSRAQRKYDVSSGNLVAVGVKDRLDCALLVELTELYSQHLDAPGADQPPRRDWTVAFEAVAPEDRIASALEAGANALFDGYDGPPLTRDHSYGYPAFALSVGAEPTQ